MLAEWIMDGTPADVAARYAGLVDAARAADYGEYDANIVVIDTETTGVSIRKDELTQIAAARLDHGEIVEWFVTFVNPGQPIPEDIVALTNITDDDVADAPTPEQALADLVEFVGDAKLVAHNAYFDKNFVTKHPAGYPLLENQWIDSLELSRIALPRMKSHRLIDLVTAFGAPLSTHRADDDVVATCALYRILLAAVDAMPTELLDEIALFANPLEWPFGEVFTFFAERKGITDKPSSFSLSTMRTARLSRLSRPVKIDAASRPTPKMLEKMQQSGATVKTADGSEVETLQFPTTEELEQAFSEEGILGAMYPDYETRSEQLEMALAVRDAFADSDNLMVEAGTGTGKSMAYLVPCALAARKNGISIGIATKTNALLDQLVYKELPALAQSLAGERDGEPGGEAPEAPEAPTAPASDASTAPLTFTPLKGYTHYPCLLKVQRILRDGPGMRDVANETKPQAPALAALLSFIEQSTYDDLDNLKIDFRVLPRPTVTTTSNDCLRRKCPFYGDACFVHGSRKLAESSDIIVTNHSLLFYDVAAENALLPPVRYWVVDEAHGVEEEARRALSRQLSLDAMARLARRVSSDDARTNVFLAASRQAIFEGNADTLFHGLVSKATAAADLFAGCVQEFARQTNELLYFDEERKSSYEQFDLWLNSSVRSSAHFAAVSETASTMIERAEKLLNASQEVVALLEDAKGAAFAQRELASVVLELKDAVRTADAVFVHPSDEYVYAVTLNRRIKNGTSALPAHTGVAYSALLYNVGATLDEHFYDAMRSVVYTSATLTVNKSFQSFEESVGLNQSESSHASCLELQSSFDYDRNMQVYVVSDMPEPTSPAYLDHLQRFLADAHIAQQGSMLTLFTNKRDMDRCYDAVSDLLSQEELRVICQRRGVSVKWLQDEFLADEALSMFALKSFWEGFDAPGATLKGVIIPKLPFGSPGNPLSLERRHRDDDAWKRYDLPKAVIEVRQAAGRLIRKATDSGVLILADSRLLTKWYGRVFVGSLPTNNVEVLTAKEICDRLSR